MKRLLGGALVTCGLTALFAIHAVKYGPLVAAGIWGVASVIAGLLICGVWLLTKD